MNTTPTSMPATRKFGCLHVLLVLIILLLAAILGSLWWTKQNIYAREFAPVELTEEKLAVLDNKLNAVDPSTGTFGGSTPGEGVYTEENDRRKIVFTQDELNAVLAKDPELAKRVKFHLSDRMVSVYFIAPFEQDVPLFGGKSLKFSMGLNLAYSNEHPVVAVQGISLGGIPLPAAWWGDIKGKNLVETFSQKDGFWNLFSRGVEYLEVSNGRFVLHLKE